MARADYLAAIGDTDYPPNEWMWEELEAEVEAIKKAEGYIFLTDREVMALGPIQEAIAAWKQRHKLEARP